MEWRQATPPYCSQLSRIRTKTTKEVDQISTLNTTFTDLADINKNVRNQTIPSGSLWGKNPVLWSKYGQAYKAKRQIENGIQRSINFLTNQTTSAT